MKSAGEKALTALRKKALGSVGGSVQGTIPEKMMFYCLVCAGLVAFFSAATGLVVDASTAILTSVKFETRKKFEYPGMYLCFPYGNTQFPGVKYTAIVKDWKAPPLSADQSYTCSDGKAEYMSKIIRNADGSMKSKSCLGMKYSQSSAKLANLSQDLVSEKASEIQGNINKMLAPATFQCLTMNDEGTMSASRDDAITVIHHEGEAKPETLANTTATMVVGFFDPKTSKENFFKDNFQYYVLDIYGMINSVVLEYDRVVDLTETRGQLSVPSFKDHAKDARNHYKAVITSAGMVLDLGNEKNGAFRAEPSIVQFKIGSFTGKNLLIRNKSLSEVWAALGGCWASSILIVATFFVGGSVVSGPDNVAQSTQVFRFRSLASRRALLAKLASATKEKADDIIGSV